MYGFGGGDMFDGCHETGSGFGFSQVFEHQDGGPEAADGVGDAFAHDVECGAVDGFEHGGEAAFGIDIGGGRDAHAAGECGGEIAQDIGVQIGGDDGVETSEVCRPCAWWRRPRASCRFRRRDSCGLLPARSRPIAPFRFAGRSTW